MRTHDTKAIVALTVAGALAVGACDFNITNPNSPPPCGSNATADQIKACAVGVLVALRVDVPRIVLNGAILGREGYRLDTADPRFTSELLEGPLDPSNDAFGGGQWATEFRTIQSGYTILNVIGSAGITSGEKDAVRGFVHTIQALAFLMILNSHVEDSIPIDVNRSASQGLAPFVSNDSAYKHVLSLLDSARTELVAATDLPFDPGPGFTLESLDHAAVSYPAEKPYEHVRVRQEKGLRPGGFGLLMVQQMVDELLYNEARNEVLFVKYVE